MSSSRVSSWIGICGLALAGGCGLTGASSDRIEVSGHNALGVESLEIERSADQGNDVFTLRGFSADEKEIASVRLTTGEITDLARWLPGGSDTGSELLLTYGGVDTRTLTRETERFAISGNALDDEKMADFVEIPQVSSVLAREGNIFVIARPVGPTENAYLEQNPDPVPFTQATNCAANQMLNKPVDQCCVYNDDGEMNVGFTTIETIHVNPDQSTGERIWNNYGNGAGCKAADGVSACSGTACYFGPFGYAKPYLTPKTASLPYGVTKRTATYSQYYTQTIYRCFAAHVATPPVKVYPAITGTQPTNAGCPGSTSGNGFWDY